MPSMKSSSRSGGTNRGGIRKRGPTRTDRDGDMDMDGSGARGGRRGRGSGGGRSTAGRSQTHGRADAIEKAIISTQDTKDTQANIRRNQKSTGSNLEQLSVRGWKESKAASNRDGGVESLLAFLERRMNSQSKGPRVKITKSRVDGDTLVVSVRPELVERMLKINGNTFAGVSITVEPHDGSVNETLGDGPGSIADTKTKMNMVLSKRYFPDTKLLDLSKLQSDPGLLAMGIFDTNNRQSKFFLAMMKVWELQFPKASERREAVMSVSLADNQLANISAVTTLSQTLPDIKNLDLTNNNLKDMDSLVAWRWKFRDLEFLDLTGNPFSADPSFKATMMKWYPNLKTLNNVQVRTAEEVALKKKTPIPIQPPYFQDEGQIADNFVRAFFPGYDNDRLALLDAFYDNNSTFSLNINTSAPRASQTGTINWDSYIKKSRNLLKITHLPARMSRAHSGIASIRAAWGSLPQTRHPDISTRPAEWVVECHPVPGLPDPTGQSATGVGGLIITVHGSFEENAGSAVDQRSFDRTFILGPGSGPGGICVLNDALCLRAYGGHEAWVPAKVDAVPPNAPPAVPGPPDGLVAPAPVKTETQLQQEQMVAELSNKSRMTPQYSELALAGNGWNLDAAWTNFEQLKLQNALPADAFLPAV